MHLSAGLSLALLSTATSFACGFSLKPQASKTFASFPNKEHLRPNIIARSPHALSGEDFTFRSQTGVIGKIASVRGGQDSTKHLATSVSSSSESSSSGDGLGDKVASLLGAGGVVMILAKSIKRILPIALEPFGAASPAPLSTFQLGAYVSMCLWFAYVEGYKGFQLKFSPLVVARAQTLKPFNGSPIHHILLAPFYSMGLFHATKKRKIISWSVSIGVGVIVAAVKKLPYPWRNIVDAGVIVGLSWGSLSIIVEWVKAAVLGIQTKMDPALPGSA